MFLLFVAVIHAADIYLYTAPDGTVVLTDSPTHGGFDLWWDDVEPGQTLPNGVPMPRLGAIHNLDDYDTDIQAAAAATGLPAELIKAVAVTESRMNPRAVSPAGAKGLMQMIPSTALKMGVTDPFDAAQSIRGGSNYLADQVNRFGDYTLALAAYNAGPGAVDRHGGVPPYRETETYVARVMGLYEHFKTKQPVGR